MLSQQSAIIGFRLKRTTLSKKTPDAYLKEVPIEIKAILDDIQFQTKIESDLYSEWVP